MSTCRLVLYENGKPFAIAPVVWGEDVLIYNDRARYLTYAFEVSLEPGCWRETVVCREPRAAETGYLTFGGLTLS